MGNRCSKPRTEQRARNMRERDPAENTVSVVVGSNRPLQDFRKYIPDDANHDDQSTKDKIKKRTVFWETQPSYSGRVEIWQMLRMVCEADDIQTAQAIMDSEGLTCPTGKLTDGVYDQWGNLYSIPPYCICYINIPDEYLMSDKADSKANSLADTTAETDEFEIKIRFSNGAPDTMIKVYLNLKISKLKKRLLATHENALKVNNLEKIQLIHLGKVLENGKRICDYKIQENTLIQVFIKS